MSDSINSLYRRFEVVVRARLQAVNDLYTTNQRTNQLREVYLLLHAYEAANPGLHFDFWLSDVYGGPNRSLEVAVHQGGPTRFKLQFRFTHFDDLLKDLLREIPRVFRAHGLKEPLEGKTQARTDSGEPSCGVCGAFTVMIRGRHPGDDNRRVCPTCAVERLEYIHEVSSKDYRQAKSA